MEGPPDSNGVVLQVSRLSQPTRLRTAWLALAYERLCPIRRIATSRPTGREDNQQHKPMRSPRVAGG
jgi:hypothetical protein